jgi:pectinesterase
MFTRRTLFSAAGALPLACARSAAATEIRAVVAADGSGDFKTVQRAVDHVLDTAALPVGRVVLEIRPGTYRERVKIPQDMPRVSLVGRDAATTVITESMSAKAAGGTFFCPITEVDCAGFEARNITFENTFGVGSQGVAISVHSDQALFRNCRFKGWQDTLYAASGRHYYRDCYIEGHVDFIFGNAAAVFDDCEIRSLGAGYIAAHRRTAPDEPTGYVFRRCRLTAGQPDLRGVLLGRPWRSFARTVYLNCWMGEHIGPEGWDNWGKPENEKTAWFAELGSTGPGANEAARVKWAHSISEAGSAEFNPETFLRGRDWIKEDLDKSVR